MDWQTPVALVCVLLAGSFVSRAVYSFFRASGKGCGTGCGSCPSSGSQPGETPLVSLKNREEGQGAPPPRDRL